MDERWKEQVRTLWQKVSEGFEKGMELARKSAEVIAEKTGETAQVTRHKLQVIRLEHQISRKFAKLGSAVYEKQSRNNGKNPMHDPEVIDLIDDLNRLESELAQTQEAFERERIARV